MSDPWVLCSAFTAGVRCSIDADVYEWSAGLDCVRIALCPRHSRTLLPVLCAGRFTQHTRKGPTTR